MTCPFRPIRRCAISRMQRFIMTGGRLERRQNNSRRQPHTPPSPTPCSRPHSLRRPRSTPGSTPCAARSSNRFGGHLKTSNLHHRVYNDDFAVLSTRTPGRSRDRKRSASIFAAHSHDPVLSSTLHKASCPDLDSTSHRRSQTTSPAPRFMSPRTGSIGCMSLNH